MKIKNILLALLCSTTLLGCSPTTSSNPSESNSDIFLVNSFENNKELSFMKFPYREHSNRGIFEFSTEHVTEGTKSIKYSNTHGTSIEMAHYFSNLPNGTVDVSNIKSVELDIFNASDFDSSATFVVYNTEDMANLLSQQFHLPKNESTHISFPLSKIALEYNYETVVCTSLRLSLDKTDYNKAIGYTFYIDNWHFKLGSEYTEQDLMYKPQIDTIKERIDALPRPEAITSDDATELYDIAKEISILPDLYRKVIPNYSDFEDCLLSYYSDYSAANPINYDLNAFIEFDQFFGSVLLKPDPNTKAEVYYTEDVWAGNDRVGSTKITFSGSRDNKFNYSSRVDLKKFDFVSFKVHNGSSNFVRIWFSYMNNVFLDIPSGETVEATYPTDIFDQGYWAIMHHASRTQNAIISASGNIYFGYSYVKGRSEETLQADLAYALSKLPASVDDVKTEDDFLNMLTPTVSAKQLFYEVESASNVTKEQYNLMNALEKHAIDNGYHLAYNAYDSSLVKFSYGLDFESNFIKDDRFGFVSTANISINPVHPEDPNKVEQGFTFSKNVDFTSQTSNGDYTMYIYNPTSYTFGCYARSTNWEYWNTMVDSIVCKPGWNRLDFRSKLFEVSSDGKICIIMSGGTASEPVDMSNEIDNPWKFSSLFRLPTSMNAA